MWGHDPTLIYLIFGPQYFISSVSILFLPSTEMWASSSTCTSCIFRFIQVYTVNDVSLTFGYHLRKVHRGQVSLLQSDLNTVLHGLYSLSPAYSFPGPRSLWLFRPLLLRMIIDQPHQPADH